MDAKYNVRKVIFSSTIEVYGDTEEKENITVGEPCNPVTYYGKSKLSAENALLKYQDSFDMLIMRFSHVYSDDFLLNLRKRVILFGKVGYYLKRGEYSFNFCSLSKISKTILDGLRTEPGTWKIIHVNDGNNMSAKELIALMAKKNMIKFAVRLPYGLTVIAVTLLEQSIKLVLKQESFISRNNLKKLFASKQYL